MAAALTQARVRLHGAGRADTYGAALLDIAQDHLLWLLNELGQFDGDTLVFKGGTIRLIGRGALPTAPTETLTASKRTGGCELHQQPDNRG